MLVGSLLLALLPCSLAFADANLHARSRARPIAKRDSQHNALSKRQTFSGRATFYDVGLGACGGYNVASDWIVALNTAQYGGGYPGPNCGKSITISYGGKTAVATIQDQCPSCGYGDLDFSRGLFDYFASEDLGQFQMSWWFNGGSGGGQQTTTQTPTSTYVAPTSTYTPPTTTSTTPAYTPAATSTTSTTTSSSSSTTSSSSTSTNSTASTTGTLSSNSTILLPDTYETNGTYSSSPTGTASTSQTSGGSYGVGNLILFNQAVTNLGNIVVVGATK